MPPVIIYSTPTCQYCKLAKTYFKEQGVDYTEFDVVVHPDKAQEMIEKSGQMGVPVIDIGGKIVVGFNQKKIAELLELSN